MHKKILPWFLLLAGGAGMLLTGGCTAPAPVPAASTAQPIIGGQTTTGDPAVVLLVATIGRSGEAYCTAEVVSPHVLMTAAHCVDPTELGGTATFQIFTGSDINGTQGSDQSLFFDISTTHFNPSFDGSQVENGNDVGVAILAQPTTITPIPMNRTALVQADIGQPLRLVGYGIDSGSDQQGTSAGTKRVVSTPLTSYDDKLIDFGDASKGTCEGDSGGPAFMTINGTEVIVGITSFGPEGCNGGSTDTRVDTISVPFVDMYVAQADPGWSGSTTGGTTGTSGSTTGGGTGSTTGGTTGSTTGGTTGTSGATNGGSGSTGGGNGGTNGGVGSTGGATGSNGSSGGATGSTGGTTGSGTSGGTTGSSSSGCQPGVANTCAANYECVEANGVGVCILAPGQSLQPKSSAGGCSVGGHDSPAAPLVFFMFLGVLIVRRKLV